MAPPLPGIAAANREALARLVAADPVLVDCVPAGEALGLGERVVLHAGPPITWDAMCPPLRGAIVGALRYEGWAATDEDAARLAATDGVRFEPCHDHAAVGPMTGLVTRSMPVFVVESINTGIAGRGAGTGQVGAGTVRAPLGCFTAALDALARARGVA